MTNEEILKKVIEKAVKNGFDYEDSAFDVLIEKKELKRELSGYMDEKHYYMVIFSHNFAKAFFGSCKGISWVFAIQQMVLEEQPLQYLKRFLSNDA